MKGGREGEGRRGKGKEKGGEKGGEGRRGEGKKRKEDRKNIKDLMKSLKAFFRGIILNKC